MDRENGFYWVKIGDNWEVAEWAQGHWWVCGSEVPPLEARTVGPKIDAPESESSG
jgi:hypothetical protein